jgi:uncharacterized RDD family membrane protein YckC
MRFFNKISYSTPESVELDFLLAGIGSRAYALFIDYSILMGVWTAFALLWATFSIGLMSYITEGNTDISGAPVWLLAIYILLNFILWGGYFILFETLWQGQTPGKRVAKIRVVQDDGRPIRLAQAALRSLLRTIDDTFFIGVFFILFQKREKRIGDLVAGTIVIQEIQSDRKAPSLAISPEAQQLAAKLPAMADMSQLIPDDYAVVREYLTRRTKMATKARNDKSLELARQLRLLIKLEEIPTGTTSDQFLEAVYVAYQEFSGDRSG